MKKIDLNQRGFSEISVFPLTHPLTPTLTLHLFPGRAQLEIQNPLTSLIIPCPVHSCLPVRRLELRQAGTPTLTPTLQWGMPSAFPGRAQRKIQNPPLRGVGFFYSRAPRSKLRDPVTKKTLHFRGGFCAYCSP